MSRIIALESLSGNAKVKGSEAPPWLELRSHDVIIFQLI